MPNLPPVEQLRPHHIVHIGGQGLRKVIQDNSTWLWRLYNLHRINRNTNDRFRKAQWADSALRFIRNIQNQQQWYGLPANQLISRREFHKLNRVVRILNRINFN